MDILNFICNTGLDIFFFIPQAIQNQNLNRFSNIVISALFIVIYSFYFYLVNANYIQPDVKKLVNMFRPLPAEQLNRRTTSQNLAFSIERLPYGKY